MAYEWGRDLTLRLIQEMKKRRFLWDTTCSDYSSRQKKKEALNEIGKLLNIEGIEVEKRMHNLRTQFNREFAKVQKSKLSGALSGHIFEPKWYGYKHLMFLKDVESQERGLCLTPEDINEEDANITHVTTSVGYLENAFNPQDCVGTSQNRHIEHCEVSNMFTAFKNNVEEEGTDKTTTLGHSEHCSVPQNSRTSQKRRTEDLELNAVFSTLKKVARSVYTKYSRDEFSVFGDYVASELRKMNDRYVVAVAKNKITQVLFEADLQRIRGGTNSTATAPSNAPK